MENITVHYALMREELLALASRSLINCHAVGLDSILFDDTPERRVRAFIANKDHELWRNDILASDWSVALHSHHCDVTLIPVLGEVFNIIRVPSRFLEAHADAFGTRVCLKAFKYTSAITNKTGEFKSLKRQEWIPLQKLKINDCCFMPAEKEHTVFVEKGKTAIWFVLEGKENLKYKPIVFSNSDLEKFDFSGLYKPMDIERLNQHLGTLREILPIDSPFRYLLGSYPKSLFDSVLTSP